MLCYGTVSIHSFIHHTFWITKSRVVVRWYKMINPVEEICIFAVYVCIVKLVVVIMINQSLA